MVPSIVLYFSKKKTKHEFFVSSVCMKAVRAALGKLEEGGSCEDAEAVCEPEVLDQIFKWKVVVYTSFGLESVSSMRLYLIGHLKLVM
jgi:hypothetical protein